MLKHSRDITFLGMNLFYTAHKREEIIHKPDLRDCLMGLIEAQEQERLVAYYKKERICVGLQKISIDETAGTATLLWAGGDKDTVDPGFWNAEENITRTERAKQKERVSVSCHMVIYFNPLPSSRFIVAKEQTPVLNTSLLQNAFTKFLAQYVKKKLSDPDDPTKFFEATPHVTLSVMASKTLKDALMGKKPIAVEAVTIQKEEKNFDEHFHRKKESKALELRPNSEWSLDGFIQNFKKLLPRLSTYEEVYIRYSTQQRQQGKLHFTRQELADNDLDSYLFAQKLNLSLDQEIGQISETIHPELTRKMKAALKGEWNLYCKNRSLRE